MAAENHTSDEDLTKVLLEPYDYILQVPGKKIRIRLASAFNYWLQVPHDKLQIIGEMTQMLHNASLLIDDIEDDSKLRRGIPVAHNIYGIPQTINAANFVYFRALDKALKLEHPDVSRIFTEQLLKLHEGQGLDILWRDTYSCPTEEKYKDMVRKKTGGLFGLSIRLMQLFSHNKQDLAPLVDSLGLYFQIRDDFANLYSKEYETSKSFAEDLTEGKFSFPIIHGIRKEGHKNRIICVLRKRTQDMEVKRFCIDYLQQIGSFDYTKEVLCGLHKQIMGQIEELGGNQMLSELIEMLSKIHTEDCS